MKFRADEITSVIQNEIEQFQAEVTRSEVGRVSRPRGAASLCPFRLPAMTRMGGSSHGVLLSRPRRVGRRLGLEEDAPADGCHRTGSADGAVQKIVAKRASNWRGARRATPNPSFSARRAFTIFFSKVAGRGLSCANCKVPFAVR